MNNSTAKPSCIQGFSLPTYVLTPTEKNGLIFLNVVNALSAFPTVLANVFVLLVIWLKPSLRCNVTFLLVFLAVSDLLVGAAVQPLFIAYTVQVLRDQVSNCAVMVAYDVLSFLLCFWSGTTYLIITLDRCVAVMYPYMYKPLVTATRLNSGVLLTWLAWTVYTFSLFFQTSGRVLSLVCSITFLVSIVVTVVVYVKMVHISRKHQIAIASQGGALENHRSKTQRNKALKTALYVVGTYLVGYLPLTVCLQVFFAVKPPKQTRFIMAHWFTTLTFLVSLLNPFIYWWRLPHMRRALLELLRIQKPQQVGAANHGV